MKPTSDDFQPRRDGWFEHEALWGEVAIGTVIADTQTRTKRWEIVDIAHGTGQIAHGKTWWMRAREQTTGEEVSVEPRQKMAKLTVLTHSPADTTIEGSREVSDSDAIMALIEGLGASLMASRDSETGEITCPDYIYDSHLDDDGLEAPVRRGLLEHIRFAHAHEVGELSLADAITLHGQCHSVEWPNIGKGGFPHRHVPEDLAYLTNTRK